MTDFFKPRPPPEPSNVRIIKTTAAEMEFAWDPPPRPATLPNGEMWIQGYEIHYQIEDAQPKRRLLDGFTTSFLIRGLGPGMLVKDITVSARSEGGWGRKSLPPISGKSSAAPPLQVDWIEVVELEAFSAWLKWAKPRSENGAVIGTYKIQAYQPGVPGSAVEIETGSPDCEYIVWALKPGTAYMFTVRAKNAAGWGSWAPLPAYGLTQAAPPNEPTNFAVLASTVDTVTLSWKIPFGNGAAVSGYEVTYEDERTKQCSTTVSITECLPGTPENPLYEDEFRMKLTGLASGSLLFQMQVRARNLAGWSAFSQPPCNATTSGKLVAFGNNESGQLGWEDLSTRNQFGNVEHMFDMVMTMAACGAAHTAVVSNGMVYTWGLNCCGQLGRFAGEYDANRGAIDIKGFMATQTGALVESINNEMLKYPNITIYRQDGPKDYLGSLGPIEKTSGACIAVACGGKHTLVLTDDGEIFAFGDGCSGVLGQGDERCLVVPKLIDCLANPGFFVDQIWCGEQYSACTVRYGQALTWGSGIYGQLGHFSTANQLFPRKVEHLKDLHIKSIACGHRHSIFVTDKGEAFSCGEGKDGKLGHGHEDSLLYPKLITSLHGVTQAACGRHHSACLLADSSLYTFGSGTRGQLGYPNDDAVAGGKPTHASLGVNTYGPFKALLPKPVSSLAGYTATGGVVQVQCGLMSTFAVTRDHQLWCWGEGAQVESLVFPKPTSSAMRSRLGAKVTGAKARGGGAVMSPSCASMFPNEYVSGLSVGRDHGMVLVTRYPPGAENDIKDEHDSDEEEQVEAIVQTAQEAVFWAGKFGYPVVLTPSEKVFRSWEDGNRGPGIDELIRRCFTEVQLRGEFDKLFNVEQKRLRTAIVKAPRLMLAKMESEEMELTGAQLAARDAETKKAQKELEEQRAIEVEKIKKRDDQMKALQARMEEIGIGAIGKDETDSNA